MREAERGAWWAKHLEREVTSVKERSISRKETLEANKSKQSRKKPQRMGESLRMKTRRLHQRSLVKRDIELKRRTTGTLKQREEKD